MTADLKSRGHLTVIAGCMFSGKTTRLIGMLRAARASGQTVLAVKHRIDDRYDATHLVTHDEDRFEAVRAAAPQEIVRLAERAAVVGIDEGHFFGMPLLAIVETLRAQGKSVIVAGIDNNAWGKPFDPMPQLIAAADDVQLNTAPCRVCGAEARYSQRMVPVTDQFMVGGADAYEPRCATCFVPLSGAPPEHA